MDSIESHNLNHSSSSPIHPHRASSIYQYHNAPEVLPAHGLEYDDTIYPISDKYPVPHDHPYASSHQLQNYNDRTNKPPRIIFGMKVRSFLLVGALFCLIVVGAVVGGTVGGRGNSNNAAAKATPSSKTGVQTVAATSTHATAAPTTQPSPSCPNTTDATYAYASTALPSNTTQTFALHCGTTVAFGANATLTAAFVYTFEDCVGICGAYNVYAGEGRRGCTAAVYEAGHARPQNCWVGVAGGVLNREDGVAVAVLEP